MKNHFVMAFLFFLLAACSSPATPSPMMGADDDMAGMMERHMAPLPDAYTSLANPVPADTASLERGQAIYAANCAICHGDDGWGDGPAAENLSPAPAPVAHTARMLSDGYLFYRVSEGGSFAPFNSAMPPFKATLSETERWDVINYLRSLSDRSLGDGAMMDGGMMMNGSYMMDGNMMNWMMAPWWFLGWVLGIGVVAAVVLAVVGTVRRSGSQTRPEDTPLEILKRRYARGEISEEQFEKMKQQLKE